MGGKWPTEMDLKEIRYSGVYSIHHIQDSVQLRDLVQMVFQERFSSMKLLLFAYVKLKLFPCFTNYHAMKAYPALN